MRLVCCYSMLAALLLVLGLFLGCVDSHATPTYRGREQGAQWRVKAAERIERIRKSDVSVQVVDVNGKPLSGARVEIVMQRHLFGFGTAVTAKDLSDQTDHGQRYRQAVQTNFNKTVFENDLKWRAWEDGSRLSQFDRALSWLNQHNIPVRGHYVVWGHLEGDEGTAKRQALPVQDLKSAVLKHAEDKVCKVGSLVAEWDVVNHPIGWGKGNLSHLFGTGFYDSVFEQVALWNPQARRYINEGGVLPHDGYNRDDYFRLLSEMLVRGAKIDGIGFMGHFKGDRDLAPPEELLSSFDRFAQFGLPLQVTEFDVRFSSEMGKPLLLTAEQEALQADYTRDFLTAAFSHPSVEGVVIWGFWEGRHWYPDAALYRRDWTPKPNGKVWEDLVLRQWWTKACGETGRDGRFDIRAFLGDYVVKVKYGGKKEVIRTFRLDRSGTTVRAVVE